MRPRRAPAQARPAGLPLLVLALAALIVLTACKPSGSLLGTAGPSTPPSPTASPSPSQSQRTSTTSSTSQSPSQSPSPSPEPKEGQCYQLSYGSAAAISNDRPPVRCRERHTAATYSVGRLDTFVDGHLLAVDSKIVQANLADTCRHRLNRLLGGSARARAMTMLKTVWFTPSVADSDLGANWFRCDVVALRAQGHLAPIPRVGALRGIVSDPGRRRRFGLCATAAPGSRRFARVICSGPHSWRALTTLGLGGGSTYPGVTKVRRAGAGRCRDVVRARVGGLKFDYGWEWPTRAQWRSDQHYGFCWTKD